MGNMAQAFVILILLTVGWCGYQWVESNYLAIDMPEPSETFDCDDSTLYMMQYFSDKGNDVYPVMGNLEMEYERPQDCNHAWLMVKLLGAWIAYDWGSPQTDNQHYEYYQLTKEQLVKAVQADFKQ